MGKQAEAKAVKPDSSKDPKGKKDDVKAQAKKTEADVLQGIQKDLLKLVDQWKATKGMLLKAFLDTKEITDAEESKFLEMKTNLARNSKKLETQLVKVNMEVGCA